MILKVISVILAALLALLTLFYRSSAVTYTVGDNEYYDLPYHHIDQYPTGIDGYYQFLKDNLYVAMYNVGEFNGTNEAWRNWDDVTTYFFGDNAALSPDYIDPRQVLSNYYIGGGDTVGVSNTQWSDGHGGYFHLEFANFREGGYSYIALYWNDRYISCVDQGTGWYKNSRIECFATDDPNVVNVKVYGDYENEWGSAYEALCINANVDTGAPANPSLESVPQPVGGSAFGTNGHLYRDPDGALHFIDDNGNEFDFNPDGTITGPDGKPYFFTPDPDSLTDTVKHDLDDDFNLWDLLLLNTLNNLRRNVSDNPSGCDCSVYLAYIAERCTSIDMLCEDMLEELKKIEKNTRNENNIFDNTVQDLVLPEDEAIQIELLSDAILKKFDFSQYFKTLNYLLGLCFGDDYKNSIDFDSYFDLDKYSPSEDSSSSGSAKKSSFPLKSSRVLRAEASSDALIESKFIEEPVKASSISSYVTLAPELNVEIFGERYNLFGWMSPEFYDIVRTLKELIRLVLLIKFYFWIIKFLPCLLNGGDVATIGVETGMIWNSGVDF